MPAVNLKAVASIAALALGACDGGNAALDAPDPRGDGNPAIDARSSSGDGAMSIDAAGGIGEPAELTGMTLYHNQVRGSVDTTGVPGGPLPALQWDPALATLAANWVAQCQDAGHDGLVDHSSPAYRSNVVGAQTYAHVGENIYAGSGPVTAHDAVFGTFGWQTEKQYFAYPNTCTGSPTGGCGHYTQVVWRATTHIGCALHMCPGLTYPYTIICNYGPGGNTGGPPY